jgi:formylglycine-generating enzyme required for sulfatase activity
MHKYAGLIVFVVAWAGNHALGQVPSFLGTHAGQVRDDNGLKMKLVWCPPRKFTMGSPNGERERNDAEDQVQVSLTKGFWLGQYEVTQRQWQRVMETTPWRGERSVEEGDNYPATWLSWDDAMKFCERLTEHERSFGRLTPGWRYTLPTEAQWEYACRAGTATSFSFGDDESKLTDYGWFDRNASQNDERYAHRVGTKKANPWGFFDMHGNVFEWCRDWYAEKLPGGTDPEGPAEGANRVDRSGGWEDAARHARSANRDKSPPAERNYDLGFRVALERVGK